MELIDFSSIKNGPLEGLFDFTFALAAPPSPQAMRSKRIRPKRELTALFLSENLDNYLAKCHQAFQTGLCDIFTVSFYDPTPRFWKRKRTLKEIKKQKFVDVPLDFVFEYCDIDPKSGNFVPYFYDIADFDGIYCLIMTDFWNLHPCNINNFIESAVKYNVDYILTYFPHPLYFFKKTVLADKIVYLLPCFDPRIFHDWQMPKKYDIGFLAAGTEQYSPFYPERFTLHNMLLCKKI
jgi:hypothetical protein